MKGEGRQAMLARSAGLENRSSFGPMMNVKVSFAAAISVASAVHHPRYRYCLSSVVFEVSSFSQ